MVRRRLARDRWRRVRPTGLLSRIPPPIARPDPDGEPVEVVNGATSPAGRLGEGSVAGPPVSPATSGPAQGTVRADGVTRVRVLRSSVEVAEARRRANDQLARIAAAMGRSAGGPDRTHEAAGSEGRLGGHR